MQLSYVGQLLSKRRHHAHVSPYKPFHLRLRQRQQPVGIRPWLRKSEFFLPGRTTTTEQINKQKQTKTVPSRGVRRNEIKNSDTSLKAIDLVRLSVPRSGVPRGGARKVSPPQGAAFLCMCRHFQKQRPSEHRRKCAVQVRQKTAGLGTQAVAER